MAAATASVDGLDIAYEVIGTSGAAWAITPGGRFTMDDPGVRELAEALADGGNRAVIWDRPNCGESSVCFEGSTESAMQADALAGLLRSLDVGPAFIAGGSGGSRVSLLTAARHPDVAAGLALWWISGGVFGLTSIGLHYCGGSITAAWNGGMEAVVELDEWQEVLSRNPANRARFLAQDRATFIETMERWLLAYCPCGDDLVPGLPDAQAAAEDERGNVERIASMLPKATLVEPPWGDTEWAERQAARTSGEAPGLFVRWPLLAPQLLEWAAALS